MNSDTHSSTISPVLTRNFANLSREVAEHVAQDQVVQGCYWDEPSLKGCFIGCLSHSPDPRIAELRFGIPVFVLRIAENIFERLPAASARQFFAALPEAVACDGKDLSRVVWSFLAADLRALPPQTGTAQQTVDQVIVGMDLLANGQPWPALETTFAAYYTARTAKFKNYAQYAAVVALVFTRATTLIPTRVDDIFLADALRAGTRAAQEACVDAPIGRWMQAADQVHLRRRDTLLRLIKEAPVVEFDSRGNATTTTAS